MACDSDCLEEPWEGEVGRAPSPYRLFILWEKGSAHGEAGDDKTPSGAFPLRLFETLVAK